MINGRWASFVTGWGQLKLRAFDCWLFWICYVICCSIHKKQGLVIKWKHLFLCALCCGPGLVPGRYYLYTVEAVSYNFSTTPPLWSKFLTMQSFILNMQLIHVTVNDWKYFQQSVPNVSKQDELAELALSEKKKRCFADFSYTATIEISIVIK